MAVAFTFYDLALAIHILAVVIAFGVVFAYPLIDAQIKQAGPEALPGLHQLHLTLARRVITPAMSVVLAAGIFMAVDRHLFDELWIKLTLVILIALFGLVGAVLTPIDKRLLELALSDLRTDTSPSPEYEAEARKAAILGSFALALVVVAIVVMTFKPT